MARKRVKEIEDFSCILSKFTEKSQITMSSKNVSSLSFDSKDPDKTVIVNVLKITRIDIIVWRKKEDCLFISVSFSGIFLVPIDFRYKKEKTSPHNKIAITYIQHYCDTKDEWKCFATRSC